MFYEAIDVVMENWINFAFNRKYAPYIPQLYIYSNTLGEYPHTKIHI